MLRIVVDARYVADHFPGIGRYTFNLLRALVALRPRHSLVALYNPSLPNTRHDLLGLGPQGLHLVPITARPFSVAEQIQVPALLRRLWADVYHAPYYVRPYWGVPCPSITTLYDTIPRRFPQEASSRARLLFDTLSRRAIAASQRIVAISHSARNDLIDAYAVVPGQVVVTPLAADARFAPADATTLARVRQHYALPSRYVLTVSSNKPHKNLVRLIEAWALLPSVGDDTTLVIAGHWDERYGESRQRAEHLGLNGRVRFLHDVAEADLPALYGGATMFAYPSLYEGFGLTPLEAMACGVPVMCGNTSSLPEVVGDAALLVDITDANAIAGGLARLLESSYLRTELAARSFDRAKHFSWRNTAEQTLRIYESLAVD